MSRDPLARVMTGLALIALLTVTLVGAAVVARRHLGDLAEQLRERQAANARLAGALVRGQQMWDAGATGDVSVFAADYLDSTQDSVATADLQSRLRAMALEKRVELVSLNTLTARPLGDVAFVGVRLAFRAPLSAVQALLHECETAQPIFFIERLSVRGDGLSLRGSETGEPGAILAVEMDVHAPKRPRALTVGAAPAVRIEPATGVARP
jgi:hypothetical protein